MPISTLSIVEQIWNRSSTMFEDSDDTDNVSLETPVKVSPVNTVYVHSSVGFSCVGHVRLRESCEIACNHFAIVVQRKF